MRVWGDAELCWHLPPLCFLLCPVTQRAWIQNSCWDPHGARAAPYDTSAFPGAPCGTAREPPGWVVLLCWEWAELTWAGNLELPRPHGILWDLSFHRTGLGNSFHSSLGQAKETCSSSLEVQEQSQRTQGCGEGTNPVTTSLWDAAVMGQASRRAFLLLLLPLSQPSCCSRTGTLSFQFSILFGGALTPLGEARCCRRVILEGMEGR